MPLKLDAEKEGKDVAAKYKVSGFPTILFIDGTGKFVHQIVGYLPPTDFAAQMELANLAGNLPALEKRVAQNPGDTKSLSSLIAIYSAQKKEKELLAALDKFRAADTKKSSGLLAKTLSSVGDYYQLENELKKAVPYFEESSMVAKDPRDLAYSLVSLGACYMGLGDKKSAIPVLERLLALGDAAKDYKAAATSMLQAAKSG